MAETINTRQRIKVYGWIGYWNDARNTNPHRQARYVMAANSKAQVVRIVGRSTLFNVFETGNKRELAAALAEPLALFVHPLDNLTEPPVKVRVGGEGVRP